MTDEEEPQYSIVGADFIARWVETHRPPPVVKRAVYDWIDGLFFDPWQLPAQPVERQHPHPQDPVLHAEVPETWVELTYAVDETHMVVRILDVRPIPEDERSY